jgi:hypothetical protein
LISNNIMNRNWLKLNCLLEFNEENKVVHGKPRKNKSFMQACWEMENDPESKQLLSQQNDDNSDSESNNDIENSKGEEVKQDEQDITKKKLNQSSSKKKQTENLKKVSSKKSKKVKFLKTKKNKLVALINVNVLTL